MKTKILFLAVISLGIVACDENVNNDPIEQQRKAAYVHPVYAYTYDGVGRDVSWMPDVLVDRETGCHYFWEPDDYVAPRIDSRGRHMGCKNLTTESSTVDKPLEPELNITGN